MTFVSWDTASKAKELSDYSVGTVWHARAATKELYLIDVVREKLEYPALRARVRSLHHRWRAKCTLIEDKGSGMSLIQDLRYAGDKNKRIPVRGIHPDGDKILRMSAASAMLEEGRVHIPVQAPWMDAFRSEIM